MLAQSLPRARALFVDGVTTLEIKSGYGLELESERRMLRVARHIGRELGVTVRTSFLGLHALPAEYKDQREAYVSLGVLRKHRLHPCRNRTVVCTCPGTAFTGEIAR